MLFCLINKIKVEMCNLYRPERDQELFMIADLFIEDQVRIHRGLIFHEVMQKLFYLKASVGLNAVVVVGVENPTRRS